MYRRDRIGLGRVAEFIQDAADISVNIAGYHLPSFLDRIKE